VGPIRNAPVILALAVVAVTLLTACGDNEAPPQSTPLPSPTSTASEAIQECSDRAQAAAEAEYGQDPLLYSSDFAEFSERFERVGDPFGVAVGSTWSDEFDLLYEELVGRSPWENPQARALYDEEEHKCLEEMGLSGTPDPLDWRYYRDLGPSPEEWPIVECVARALVATEAEYGDGSVDYTTAYRSFVGNRSEESTDLLRYEQDYERLTGRSPFRNPAAMEAFRAKARTCPEG